MSKVENGVTESHDTCATVACEGLFERLVGNVITNQAEGTWTASKHCYNVLVL